jgi:hypothetical protein
MEQPQSAESEKSASAPFFRLIRNPIKFRLFLFTNLPSAYFSGLRIPEADGDHCVVTVPYKWSTRNPFRSIYFACLSMAAEMSSGALSMAYVYKSDPPVSMLVIQSEAAYFKKATGLIRFTCSDGSAIREAIDRARATGEGQTLKVYSIGANAAGEKVAEFFITWSFKVKSRS